MDTKSALYQLMDIRLNGIPDEILRNDDECWQISQKSGEYLEKLDAMTLPSEIRLLIDRHASEQNALGARCGALAYLLEFSDCIDLTCVSDNSKTELIL